MGRRRLQKQGDLRAIAGYWRVRWREDQIQSDGLVKYGWSRFHDIGPATGRGRMTRPQAERAAWENYLSRLDRHMRTPQSILTVGEFVERRFLPEHVAMLKPGGRAHYAAMLAHVVEGIPERRRSFAGVKMKDGRWPEAGDAPRRFGLGEARMRDVRHEDVQRLVSGALERGYSVQTAKHLRTCVSAVFHFAEKVRWFSGTNPAKYVRLPEMTRRPVAVLSFEQLRGLLEGLKPMARAMVLCASLTSMNIAEVCGLRWKRVNLTPDPVLVDGEPLAAFHVAVREQWLRGAYGSPKTAARRRILPLPRVLVEALTELRDCAGVKNREESRAGFKGGPDQGARDPRPNLYGSNPPPKAARQLPNPDAPVFAGESGRPVDAGAMLRRQVRPAAKAIGIEGLGWHDLRRTFATLADQIGMSLGERQALMGHARAAQTMAYTFTPGELAIAALEKLGEKVKGRVN